jgi:hypothetical protein
MNVSVSVSVSVTWVYLTRHCECSSWLQASVKAGLSVKFF